LNLTLLTLTLPHANIPCGLTPAELPAREQSHEQNSDFTTPINLFPGRQPRKLKFFLRSSVLAGC
jgi:hypothetical protein